MRPQVPRVQKQLEQLELRRRGWTLQVGIGRGREVTWGEGKAYHLVESWRVLRKSLKRSGEQRPRDRWSFPKATQQAGVNTQIFWLLVWGSSCCHTLASGKHISVLISKGHDQASGHRLFVLYSCSSPTVPSPLFPLLQYNTLLPPPHCYCGVGGGQCSQLLWSRTLRLCAQVALSNLSEPERGPPRPG